MLQIDFSVILLQTIQHGMTKIHFSMTLLLRICCSIRLATRPITRDSAVEYSIWQAGTTLQVDPVIYCSIRQTVTPFQRDSAIGCSTWYAVNPLQRDSARACSIWYSTYAYQPHTATGYSIRNATSHFGVNTLNKTVSSCKLVPTPPFSLRLNNMD